MMFIATVLIFEMYMLADVDFSYDIWFFISNNYYRAYCYSKF